MAFTSDEYAALLRTADLRVTRPRVAVLEAVEANPHADTETVFGVVRTGLPEVSRRRLRRVGCADLGGPDTQNSAFRLRRTL